MNRADSLQIVLLGRANVPAFCMTHGLSHGKSWVNPRVIAGRPWRTMIPWRDDATTRFASHPARRSFTAESAEVAESSSRAQSVQSLRSLRPLR